MGGPSGMTALGWGVLGAARIARSDFLPAVAASPSARLAAVGARDLGRAAEMVEGHPGARAYGSYDEVLSDPAVDAIYVALPNSLHTEWTVRALEAGKHVLCEKPMARSSAEVQEIAAAAGPGRPVVMEGFMYRFHPQYDTPAFTALLAELGEITTAHAHFSVPLEIPDDFRLSAELGGGAFWDLGCYCVHALMWLLGDVTEARGTFTGHPDVAGSAWLRFASGATGTASWGFTGTFAERLLLVGTAGVLDLELPFLASGAGTIRLATEHGDRTWTPAAGNQFRTQVDHFSAVVRGDADLRIPLSETLRWVTVAENLR
ncbi:Gfo/Idh/MocA family oxidoreductase [Nonomuraea diastatica]|uniref:Gfo/Idh/MocA family oxidoreductase n=2 Tax=Nonomuraea diastatica TaxID=1848329 RepID=A0A4R4WME6_9ACTN|nr:Gfo/Idh/MocA family oxidoreductase [Nonomuraea diastatica]